MNLTNDELMALLIEKRDREEDVTELVQEMVNRAMALPPGVYKVTPIGVL